MANSQVNELVEDAKHVLLEIDAGLVRYFAPRSSPQSDEPASTTESVWQPTAGRRPDKHADEVGMVQSIAPVQLPT